MSHRRVGFFCVFFFFLMRSITFLVLYTIFSIIPQGLTRIDCSMVSEMLVIHVTVVGLSCLVST